MVPKSRLTLAIAISPTRTKRGIGNGEFEHEFDHDCTHDLPLMGLAAFTKAVAVLGEA